jgi:hypothetical protein
MSIKSQGVFPVSERDTDEAFTVMSRFDEGDLTTLKHDYMHYPHAKLIRELLECNARPEIVSQDDKRRPYRAGVILGSYIARHQIRSVGIEPVEVLNRDVIGSVNWSAMAASRFALRQFFDEGVDVKKHMYRTIEYKWAMSGNPYAAPEAIDHQPAEDWMTIGLGDTCRLVEVAHADYVGEPARNALVVRV